MWKWLDCITIKYTHVNFFYFNFFFLRWLFFFFFPQHFIHDRFHLLYTLKGQTAKQNNRNITVVSFILSSSVLSKSIYFSMCYLKRDIMSQVSDSQIWTVVIITASVRKWDCLWNNLTAQSGQDCYFAQNTASKVNHSYELYTSSFILTLRSYWKPTYYTLPKYISKCFTSIQKNTVCHLRCYSLLYINTSFN